MCIAPASSCKSNDNGERHQLSTQRWLLLSIYGLTNRYLSTHELIKRYETLYKISVRPNITIPIVTAIPITPITRMTATA